MPARVQRSGGRRNSTGALPRADALRQSISSVLYADYDIKPWYPSYYNQEIIGKHGTDQLYVCTHCFKYSTDLKAYATHMLNACEYRDRWPGWMCYDKGDCEIFEIDGDEHLLFAQNLSLFGKLFIENKSVCFDVSGFIYYILVQDGQIVGFFSKEKLSWDNNNLACILVFPPYQGRGYGQKLMAASYVMSTRDGRLGGPERPLSEPGKKSYEAYWARAIAESIFHADGDDMTIQDICDATSIVSEDVSMMLVKMAVVDKSKTGILSINKASLREWVARAGLDMRPPLDMDGFIDPPDESSASDASGSGLEDASHESADELTPSPVPKR